MATKKSSGYIAVHELHYNDELEGPVRVNPGDDVPAGAYKDQDIEFLTGTGAIRKSKDVKEEQKAQAEAAADAQPKVASGKPPVASR
jgi:hypothetical protein